MTNIILIRHGQTEWNVIGRLQGRTDIALTDNGKEQASLVAKWLEKEKIDAVYSSDLSRAYETAKSIASYHKLSVTAQAGLRELDLGIWEGMSVDDVREKWPQDMDLFFSAITQVKIPEAETIYELSDRVCTSLENIVAAHPNQTVVVVAHGVVIRAVLARYLKMSLDWIWSMRQDNTAVNRIGFYEDSVVVEGINDICHLKMS